jgi:hypothetical protein
MGRNIFSKSVSWILNPLLVPTLACFIVFYSGHYLQFVEPKLLNAILVVFFSTSFILPSLIIPLMYFQGVIPNFKFVDLKYRRVVLLILLIIYGFSTVLMSRFGFPSILVKTMLAFVLGVALMYITSFFVSLSFHTSAWGALLGLVFYLSLNFALDLRLIFVLCLLVTAIVSTCRMILKMHKPKEIYLAFVLGFLTMSLGMLLLNNMNF